MACMLNGGPAASAFQPCMEMMISRLTEVELEQVVLSFGAGCDGGKEENDALSYRDVISIDEEERSVIKIPAHLHQVLLQVGPRIKAFMAKPAGVRTFAENDKSVICADCGVSMTITCSLANTTDVVEKDVIVDMPKVGQA